MTSTGFSKWQKIVKIVTGTDSMGSDYLKWHTTSGDGYYPPEFDLSDSEYDITKKLDPYGIIVNMDKSGKYDLIRASIIDFYGDDDDFGIIDLGGMKITMSLNFHFKRYKNPLMNIEVEFSGPEGHIGILEGDKFKISNIPDNNNILDNKWFPTIHFAIYDDVIYDGNKKGIIIDKVESSENIPVYKVHNLEDNKVYNVKADNMIHDTEKSEEEEEGVIDICLIDDFM